MIKNKQTIFFILAGFMLGLMSCDKISFPYTENTGGGNDTALHIRKILVEDYTGHTCGNCPKAAISAKEIKQLYGKKAIIMAVHVGYYALPKSYPDGSFAYDFRTTAGNDYGTFFGNDNAGLPNGMVNRKPVTSSPILNHKDWSSVAQGIVNLPPDADISITNTYDSLTRNVNIIVQVHYLKTISSIPKLVVCLTEDSIVNWQKDYAIPSPSNIPMYLHRHVLRGAVNSSWGDALASGFPGLKTSKNYSIKLNTGWKAKQCSVVAFLYDAASYEVIQAEEKHVINN